MQAESYAVLTRQVLPKAALVKITRWDGSLIWEPAKAKQQKEKLDRVQQEATISALPEKGSQAGLVKKAMPKALVEHIKSRRSASAEGSGSQLDKGDSLPEMGSSLVQPKTEYEAPTRRVRGKQTVGATDQGQVTKEEETADDSAMQTDPPLPPPETPPEKGGAAYVRTNH